jgi:hypothetical protein
MKNFLISKICFLILTIAVCAITGEAQRKTVPLKSAVSTKIVTGVLYYGGEGQGIQTCLLAAPEGLLEISVTKKTRVVNFPADGSAWNLGAEWRVAYRESKDKALGLEAIAVTFTGKIVKAIEAAENVAKEFAGALPDENKDYKTAYSKLSERARQNLSFAAFTKMYKGIEVLSSTVRVCSFSDEKVVVLLTLYAVEPDNRFQLIEIARAGAGVSSIDRLFDLQKTEAAAGCR